ncbi:DUF389 domain-containing protein [Terrabacter sp. 2RAF25]|uniref:DUF389 domain-containing protein n=1 Tax=Terrabacter sp. 2RAF25 TaxID=3232998 RepID=UPI003F968C86
MLRLTATIPSELTEPVTQLLADSSAVSTLSVLRGAALRPVGDVVQADVSREGANAIVESLRDLGVHEGGTLQLEPVSTWVSRAGFEADEETPGSSADAVVWAEVAQRSYEESELNWTFLSFMSLATLIAGIAIVLDTQILVIGAMVLGPEFGAIAALGVALVRRRPLLLAVAARALAVGFAVAIAVTCLAALVGRALGWVTLQDITGDRPATAFIYSPDKWSFVVAVLAAAAGVLSLTSARVTGLSGVFISVTTIPAAGNVALGLAFGAWGEVRGSGLQLVVNIIGMALAGWLTLALQRAIWSRVPAPRSHSRLSRHVHAEPPPPRL